MKYIWLLREIEEQKTTEGRSTFVDPYYLRIVPFANETAAREEFFNEYDMMKDRGFKGDITLDVKDHVSGYIINEFGNNIALELTKQKVFEKPLRGWKNPSEHSTSK